MADSRYVLSQLMVVQVEVDIDCLQQEPGAGVGPVPQVQPLVHKFGGHHLEVDDVPPRLLRRPAPRRIQLRDVGVLIEMQVQLPALAVHAVCVGCGVEYVHRCAGGQLLHARHYLRNCSVEYVHSCAGSQLLHARHHLREWWRSRGALLEGSKESRGGGGGGGLRGKGLGPNHCLRLLLKRLICAVGALAPVVLFVHAPCHVWHGEKGNRGLEGEGGGSGVELLNP